MENPDDKKIGNSARVADHLANERTFLAWIRTAIALMGFGFVIVKFALFIRELSAVLGEKLPNPGKGYSAIIGVVMVALGAVMAALSYILSERFVLHGAYALLMLMKNTSE